MIIRLFRRNPCRKGHAWRNTTRNGVAGWACYVCDEFVVTDA